MDLNLVNGDNLWNDTAEPKVPVQEENQLMQTGVEFIKNIDVLNDLDNRRSETDFEVDITQDHIILVICVALTSITGSLIVLTIWYKKIYQQPNRTHPHRVTSPQPGHQLQEHHPFFLNIQPTNPHRITAHQPGHHLQVQHPILLNIQSKYELPIASTAVSLNCDQGEAEMQVTTSAKHDLPPGASKA